MYKSSTHCKPTIRNILGWVVRIVCKVFEDNPLNLPLTPNRVKRDPNLYKEIENDIKSFPLLLHEAYPHDNRSLLSPIFLFKAFI